MYTGPPTVYPKSFFLYGGTRSSRKSYGVEGVVAHKFVSIAVKLPWCPTWFRLHCTGAVAAILSAVIRGQDLEFRDGIDAGIDVQRCVAAVVHVVAAVQFPVVVLGASAVNAVSNVAVTPTLPRPGRSDC